VTGPKSNQWQEAAAPHIILYQSFSLHSSSIALQFRYFVV